MKKCQAFFVAIYDVAFCCVSGASPKYDVWQFVARLNDKKDDHPMP
jgi:hypothetical protein